MRVPVPGPETRLPHGHVRGGISDRTGVSGTRSKPFMLPLDIGPGIVSVAARRDGHDQGEWRVACTLTALGRRPGGESREHHRGAGDDRHLFRQHVANPFALRHKRATKLGPAVDGATARLRASASPGYASSTATLSRPFLCPERRLGVLPDFRLLLSVTRSIDVARGRPAARRRNWSGGRRPRTPRFRSMPGR